MTGFDYDFFVIGGGSGGVRAARIAAGHGAKVAIAEECRFGGTCVIRGCVPKKLLVYASRFRDDFEDAAGFGWQVPGPVFDWPSLIAAKDKEISRLEGVYEKNLRAAGVEIFPERAEFADAHTLRLAASGRQVTADKILIATGGGPSLPAGFDGRRHVITSNEAFDLEALPGHVVIYGGGYIAVEFAGIFNGLGARTTLVYRRDKVLRGFDEDLRDASTEAMQKRGINLVLNANITAVGSNGGSKVVTLDNGEELVADKVMFATGRDPNTKGLGLDRAGVQTKENGAVVVDRSEQTSSPNIYAVGDVTDRVQLTPVAIREGHALADRLFGDGAASVDYEMIPTAVFSTPEIGTVGFAEHDAVKSFGTVDVYQTAFRPMRATLAGRDERMLMKLLVAQSNGRVVGCHILGDDAGEIVQSVAIAMRMGATKADFDRTMALHPSAAEELVTMRQKTRVAS